MRLTAALAVALLLPVVAVAQFQPGGFGPGKFGRPVAGPTSFADVAEVSVTVDPPAALPGEVVTVKLTITPKPGCTTYPFLAPPEQVSKNNFNPSPENLLVFIGPLVDPPGQHTKQKEGKFEQVYTDATTWEFKAVVSPKAQKTDDPTIRLRGFGLLACNEGNCFPFSGVTAPLKIQPGEPKAVPAEYRPWVDAHLSGKPRPLDWVPEQPKQSDGPSADTAAPAPSGEMDWGKMGQMMLLAAGWGLISLITPCVFPMIPITVSLFLKQSHNSARSTLAQAAVYCLTIIVMLGVPTVFVLGAFSKLSVDPYMNVFLGGLFVFFALSLFGAYEATIRATFWFVSVFGGAVALASFLVTQFSYASAGQTWVTSGQLGRAIAVGVCWAITVFLFCTRRPGSQDGLVKYADAKRKAGGLVGTIFGAMLFSIISFTCVAPFLGAFAGLVSTPEYANGNEWKLIPVGLAFSTAFASPFFVLALFPSLIKKMPKSGGWLDIVKAVMGFIELAAAFKFARTAELRWLDPPEYFTYSLCLAAFVVISGVCGLYLLGVFRLPHDDEERSKLSAPRLLFALAFLGFGVYLVPGLFQGPDGGNQRPKGVVFAWVDSFLLPDAATGGQPTGSGGGGEAKGEKPSRDLETTRNVIAERVKKWDEEKKANPSAPPPDKRFIFVDFTGVTCSNCKLNERNVFPRSEVAELLKKYTEVQLYTDTVPTDLYAGTAPRLADRDAEAEKNKKYQVKEYGTEQLPLYVILEVKADGSTVTRGVYPEGKINDVPAFVEFLKKPLEGK